MLVNELGLEIRIAHDPPDPSKDHPIAHRLGPHGSRVGQGVSFEPVQTVQDLIATATTRTNLNGGTTILDTTYQTGRTVAEGFQAKMKIGLDEFLSQRHDTAKPALQVI